jgi:hypothetical protein
MATPPDFTSGQVLTAAQMNSVGMWLVKSQTVGTGVSSVSVTNAFSADYDNYLIQIYGCDSSSLNNIVSLQLNNSTGSTYASSSFYIIHGGATGSNTGTSNSFRIAWGGDVSDTNATITLYSPFLARRTGMTAQNANASLTGFNGGTDTNAVSNTGFTITTGADTLTGGTINVYGYNK